MNLSLDALRVVDAIDRRGTFSAAARELGQVPSTISYTVSRLEDALGVPVFDRHGPRVALTDAGRVLLDDGRQLLQAARALERRVQHAATGWEAELVIAMDSMFSPVSLAADVAAFYLESEGTRLRFSQDSLTGVWEALLDGRVDLVVGAAGDGPAGGTCGVQRIGAVGFVFAVAPGHPLASMEEPLGRADIQPHRAISVADSARKLVPRSVGLLPGQEVLTVADMDQKLAFQLAGLGVGFLPEPLARPWIEQGRLLEKEVETPRAEEVFHLAWRKGENGAALKWWRKRLGASDLLARLLS